VTREEYQQVLVLVSATWPNWQGNRSTFKAGLYLLEDLDYDRAIQAVRELAVEEPRFAPGLGAIRAKALEVETPDMDQAWQEVQDNIRRVGIKAVYYGAGLSWSSPAIAAAVEAMGWKALCESENEVADRAHFFKVYERCVERVRRQAVLPGLEPAGAPELTP